MKKILVILFVVIVALVIGFFALNSYIYNEKQEPNPLIVDYTNAEFVIDGEPMKLGDTLRYFGNEYIIDLNNDGKDDSVFLVTYSGGGSGTFYYVVAAVSTDAGYVGSDGYLLGDRIAPQTTELSQNPDHQNVIVVNYADRAQGEPMTAQPSEGKSAYLKLDTQSMQWGIVESDFPGEANPDNMTLSMKTWVWERASFNDGREVVPAQADAFTLTFEDEDSFSVTTDCNRAGGTYATSEDFVTFSNIFSTKMFCEGSQEGEFLQLLENTTMYHFTSKGELILDLKFDSGTVTFR